MKAHTQKHPWLRLETSFFLMVKWNKRGINCFSCKMTLIHTATQMLHSPPSQSPLKQTFKYSVSISYASRKRSCEVPRVPSESSGTSWRFHSLRFLNDPLLLFIKGLCRVKHSRWIDSNTLQCFFYLMTMRTWSNIVSFLLFILFFTFHGCKY